MGSSRFLGSLWAIIFGWRAFFGFVIGDLSPDRQIDKSGPTANDAAFLRLRSAIFAFEAFHDPF